MGMVWVWLWLWASKSMAHGQQSMANGSWGSSLRLPYNAIAALANTHQMPARKGLPELTHVVVAEHGDQGLVAQA
jgi:hypothetical protein